MARCRARSINERQRLLMLRGNGWHAPFGASPPFLGRGRIYFSRRGGHSSGTGTCRENDISYPPPRSETERGRGTMRSMVEGACGGAASDEAVAPSTALARGPPSPLRGAGCGNGRRLRANANVGVQSSAKQSGDLAPDAHREPEPTGLSTPSRPPQLAAGSGTAPRHAASPHAVGCLRYRASVPGCRRSP
jgi:hypothetical protein